MIKKTSWIFFAASLAIFLVWFLSQSFASAATSLIGCKPYNLTVRTGQTFYFTVAVTDTLDLFAWQFDASYSNTYLEFVALLPGDHLRKDGASHYVVSPIVAPGSSTNEMRLAAATRLGQNIGVDGNGAVAHLLFRAVNQKTDGTTVTLNDVTLGDRNALEISRSLANSGRCKVIILDSAPILIQPGVGESIFLPALSG